jgi:hypothetical protein
MSFTSIMLFIYLSLNAMCIKIKIGFITGINNAVHIKLLILFNSVWFLISHKNETMKQ